MKACRTASIVAFGALFTASAIGACRENAAPTVPPVTTAEPPASAPSLVSKESSATADAASPGAATPTTPATPPFAVAISDLPAKVAVPSCGETAIAVVSGNATVLDEKLAAGDVMIVRGSAPIEMKGTGLVVTATQHKPSNCVIKTGLVPKEIVRVATTPELVLGKGAARVRMQVGEAQRADFYLGRLDAAPPTPEHVHKGSWEILAVVDAAGTLVVDGKEQRLGPKQVVSIPPDTKHEWRPDPGTRLKVVQIYSPSGPEQRFLAGLAAEKDAGADAGKK